MLNRKIAIGVSVPVMALALSATASFANSKEVLHNHQQVQQKQQ